MRTLVTREITRAEYLAGLSNHRHLPTARVAAYVYLGCYRADDGGLAGVASVGRPASRALCAVDPGLAEVDRVATDGTRNACSALYGACRRWAKRAGYTRLLTYTLPGEGGASLRAAGWTLDTDYRGRRRTTWASVGRARATRSAEVSAPKVRWWLPL